MKYDKFRRSENVEDFRDPTKPVPAQWPAGEGMTIKDMLALTNSQLAKDAGSESVKQSATEKKDQSDAS